MARHFPNWLTAYVQYAGVGEAPAKMHFWAGIGAIAACLRRRVWIDMKRFTWTPGFYIIFVAPPGIVQKSTTIDIAMDLVKQVSGVRFGPNVATWQALATAFAAAGESFEFPLGSGDWHPMSAVTLVASELGSLLNLQDRDLVSLLIELWDGKKSHEKLTKGNGCDMIEAPWINLEAGTTPHWIAENMPASTVGGGLTSRCIFIYAEEKERFVPYVDEMVGKDDKDLRLCLIQDLEHITMELCGPYTITPEARDYGRRWYENFWKLAKSRMDNRTLEGYAARKQTHLHKTAMVIAAAQRDERIITDDDLQLANAMLENLEPDMQKVFDRIGRSEMSLNAERLLKFIASRGQVPVVSAYREVHAAFPDSRDYEAVLAGLVRSGQVAMVQTAEGMFLRPTVVTLSDDNPITEQKAA